MTGYTGDALDTFARVCGLSPVDGSYSPTLVVLMSASLHRCLAAMTRARLLDPARRS